MAIEPFLALFAAFSVGTADFLSRFTGEGKHPARTALRVMGIGALLSALWIILFHQGDFTLAPRLIGVTAFAGMLNAMASICLYTALRRGPIALASPLCALSSIFLTAEWAFFGVFPDPFVYVGVGAATLGAMMIGFSKKSDPEHYTSAYKMITALLALAVGFLFASRLFLLQVYADEIDVARGFFYLRLFSFFSCFAILFFLFYVKKEQNASPFPDRGIVFFSRKTAIACLQGVAETVGIALLLYSSREGVFRVSSPAIFSSFSVFTTLWAVFFLKEKIAFTRGAGIALTVLGVAIIQLFSKYT